MNEEMMKLLMRIGAEMKEAAVPTGMFFLVCWMLVLLLVPLTDYSFTPECGKYVYTGLWAMCAGAVCVMFLIHGDGKRQLILRIMCLGCFILLQTAMLYYLRNFAIED